jgi:DNA-binding transcriptional regulator YiaG
LRYDLGLTAKNFAASLGTEFSAYQDWIAGRSTPSPYFLRKMHELRAGIGTADSVPVLTPDELRAIRAASGLNIYKFAARVDASASEILEGENGARMVRPQTNRKLVAFRDELARNSST